MNPIMLDLGVIKIYYYSVMILLGMIIGVYLIYKELKKRGFSEDFITDLLFYTIVFGIIGAIVQFTKRKNK